MKVRLKLFAVARQLAGDDTIELDVPNDATVAVVRQELVRQIPELVPMGDQLRFAVNADYAGNAVAVSAADEIACIPPVSGG